MKVRVEENMKVMVSVCDGDDKFDELRLFVGEDEGLC